MWVVIEGKGLEPEFVLDWPERDMLCILYWICMIGKPVKTPRDLFVEVKKLVMNVFMIMFRRKKNASWVETTPHIYSKLTTTVVPHLTPDK